MTDTIEAVVAALRLVPSWDGSPIVNDAHLTDAEVSALAQAAIASHTKALIEGAGELERELAHVGRDGTWKANQANPHPMCTQAAATIAALRAENGRAKEEGVRAGIEAAAAWMVQWATEPMAEVMRGTLDAAAIAKGV